MADPGEPRDLIPLGFTLLKWSLFGVVFAVLPIIFNLAHALTRRDDISFAALLSHGELLLVSVAVAAASVGELFGARREAFRRTRMILVAASMILICLASGWFADIAAGIRAGEDLDDQLIAIGSLVMFIFATISGACCVLVAELSR